jgi:pimeloyl-ACP methyl ester carboxylesterase
MAMVVAGDGAELYAETHGEGLPVVFSCALCTTHVNWAPQVEALVAAGMQVILWDYRGHGNSSVPTDAAAYSIERVIDDLGCVLDWAAPGRSAVLAGLSFGGLASLHFTLRHPERVRGLLLVDSGPGFKNPEAQAGWADATDKSASFVEALGMAAFVERAGSTLVGSRSELPAAKAAAAAIAAQDPTGVAYFARRVAGAAPPVIDELPSIDVPALVIVGENDLPYLRAADVMAAKLPRAEKLVIPGAGHIVNIEASEVFDAAAIDFLSRF